MQVVGSVAPQQPATAVKRLSVAEGAAAATNKTNKLMEKKN